MCDSGIPQSPEDEEIIKKLVVELWDWGMMSQPSDPEYQEGIAKVTKEEVALVIESKRQIQVSVGVGKLPKL